MAVRKNYHVTHSVNGWKAEQEDSEIILCEAVNKNDVIDCITQKAMEDELSHLIIHNREGDFQEERIFANGITFIKNKE